jgi:phage terminase small subunit
MLTAKQEKFVRNLVKGMSQREAYKNSYDAENMSDEAIDVEACRLFKDAKISLRYKELQEKLDKATIMTAQERLEYLTGIILDLEREKLIVLADGEEKEIERPAELAVKLKAIDIMNKMQGEYVQKIEADVNSDITINIELSDDE